MKIKNKVTNLTKSKGNQIVNSKQLATQPVSKKTTTAAAADASSNMACRTRNKRQLG